MVHIVLVRDPYASAIEAGRKRVEARLSRARHAPFGRVAPGDILWFRRVGGDYFGSATVRGVTSREGLTPAAVRALGRRFGRRVGAGAAFWEGRRAARYATMIEFEGFEASFDGPRIRKRPGDRRAWIVIDEEAAVGDKSGGVGRRPAMSR